MPGLIDSNLGLADANTGFSWLFPGLGSDGLWNGGLTPPSGEMITEAGVVMVTEAATDTIMVTEN